MTTHTTPTKPMSKAELVDALATQTGSTKAEAKRNLDAMATLMTAAVAQGGLALAGFGSFSVSTKPARTGRNPRTGEKLIIPARKHIKFSAAKALKEAV